MPHYEVMLKALSIYKFLGFGSTAGAAAMYDISGGNLGGSLGGISGGDSLHFSIDINFSMPSGKSSG